MRVINLRVIIFSVPLVIFMLLGFLLWRGLYVDHRFIPSTLLGQAAPLFNLPVLGIKAEAAQDPLESSLLFSNQQLKGKAYLLNIWASWCEACTQEQSVLLEIKRHHRIPIIGLNYKDDPANARSFLKQWGNPYEIIVMDETGKAAIDWGVYGTPETFLVDQKGQIRYKYVGPLTWKIVDELERIQL